MTKREKFLIVCLTLIGLLASYYFFVFEKQYDEIISLETKIDALNTQITIYEVSKRNVPKLEDKRTKIVDELEEVFLGYFSDIEQEEIISLITEVLIRSDVEVTNLSFSENSQSEFTTIDYNKLNVMISVSGEYNEIVNFMSSFWRFNQNIFIESMSLTEGDEDVLNGFINVAFIRLNNDYTEDVTLFKWYEDVIYEKDNPFDNSDFTSILNPNYFYTGTDVEFYNPPFEGFSDMNGHWAEEVINFFGRNGFILPDENNNANPESSMTRLDTVVLLDLVFRWELSEDLVSLEGFDDYNQIAELSDLERKTLLKAYNSDYLFGYDDNTLRPYSSITYEELGYIGANLLGDSNVNWTMVASELRDEFGYESPGLENNQLLVTKAEIIYFLNYIDNRY